MKLKNVMLSFEEHRELKSKYKDLTNAEVLAWIVELTSYLEKRLESLRDNCSDPVNEGTDEEEMVLNPFKYQTEKMKINKEVIQILDNNFYYQMDGVGDLFEAFGINVAYPYTEDGVKDQLKYLIPISKVQLQGKEVAVLKCTFHNLTLTAGNPIDGLNVFNFDGRAKVTIEGDGDIAVIEETYQISGNYTIISDSVCIIDVVRLR